MRWRTDSKSHRENTLEDHLTNKLQKKAAEVCYKNKTGACIAYKNLTVLLSPVASTGPPFPPPPKTSVTDRHTDGRSEFIYKIILS
jgi:hypothetical protein